MPTARAGAVGGVLDAELFVIGGFNAQVESVQTTVEVYNPETNSWKSQIRIPTARVFSAAGVLADVLYVVGGYPAMAVNEAFSPFLAVGIDIKPGDATNSINLRSAGTVPVAILGSATFDPMTVDPTTVTLAGATVATRGQGQPMVSQGDFNRDGYLDLLLHFRTQDLKLTPASTEAVLYGTTFSGQRIRGSDSVRIVRAQPRGTTTRVQAPGSRN